MTSPLSAKELDELRDVASYEAKGVRVRALVLSMRRLLATIEARERRIALLEARTLSLQIDKGTAERENAALAAKLANIRKLCDEYRDLAGFADIIRQFRAELDAKPGVEET
jgi:hypothetical protein